MVLSILSERTPLVAKKIVYNLSARNTYVNSWCNVMWNTEVVGYVDQDDVDGPKWLLIKY